MADDGKLKILRGEKNTLGRTALWALTALGAFTVMTVGREISGTGLFNGVENAAEHFSKLDFTSKVQEWWHYYRYVSLPALGEVISKGAQNAWHYINGNSQMVESISKETLEHLIPANLESLLVDASFVGSIASVAAAFKNFVGTIIKCGKRVIRRK